MKHKHLNLVATTLIAFLIVGCAGFLNWWNNNRDRLQLAVDIAVAATVDAHPESAPVIAKAAKAVVDVVKAGQTVTLVDLDAFVMTQINLPGLSGPDRKVLGDLVGQLSKSLDGYFVSQNITDPLKQLVIVQDVAQMVVDSLSTPAMTAHIRRAKAPRGYRMVPI